MLVSSKNLSAAVLHDISYILIRLLLNKCHFLADFTGSSVGRGFIGCRGT